MLKEILGLGESLAGRLLIYDARATRFTEIKVAWDPTNPLSGKTPTIRDLHPARRAAKTRSAPPNATRAREARVAIRGILFDKDGTVIDYWRTWVPINREVAAVRGQRRRGRWPRSCCGSAATTPHTDRITPGSVLAAGSVDDIADAFAAPAWARAPPPELATASRPSFAAVALCTRRWSTGLAQTLAELKRRGLRLGLATNDSTGGLEASLAGHDILDLFDFARRLQFGLRRASPTRAWCWRSAGRSACRREPSPWSAMPCTTSPWVAPRASAYGRRAIWHERARGPGALRRPDPAELKDLLLIGRFSQRNAAGCASDAADASIARAPNFGGPGRRPSSSLSLGPLRAAADAPDEGLVAPVEAGEHLQHQEAVVHGERAFQQAVPGLEDGGRQRLRARASAASRPAHEHGVAVRWRGRGRIAFAGGQPRPCTRRTPRAPPASTPSSAAVSL